MQKIIPILSRTPSYWFLHLAFTLNRVRLVQSLPSFNFFFTFTTESQEKQKNAKITNKLPPRQGSSPLWWGPSPPHYPALSPMAWSVHLSPVTCHLSPITCHLYTCHLSPVTCHMLHVTCRWPYFYHSRWPYFYPCRRPDFCNCRWPHF